jgi:hypothetical protein
MKEAELLATIAAPYRLTSAEPTFVSNPIQGLTKMTVRVFDGNSDQTPPIGNDHLVDYYVIDRGLETEEAFLSVSDVDIVQTVAADVAVKTALAVGKAMQTKIDG